MGFDMQVGYSSPAQTGIMDELGLSLAEVSLIIRYEFLGVAYIFTWV